MWRYDQHLSIFTKKPAANSQFLSAIQRRRLHSDAEHEKDDGAHLQLAMTMLQEQNKYFKLIGHNLMAIKGTLYPQVFKIRNFRLSTTKSETLQF